MLTHLFIFVFCFLFFYSLSIRRMHLPPVLYYLMSPSLRYVSLFSSFFFFSFAHISSTTCHWLSHFPFSIIVSYEFLCSSFFPFFFLFVFQDEPEPISVYHPTAEEIFASMGTPMEGFFDGADVVFKTATLAPFVAV